MRSSLLAILLCVAAATAPLAPTSAWAEGRAPAHTTAGQARTGWRARLRLPKVRLPKVRLPKLRMPKPARWLGRTLGKLATLDTYVLGKIDKRRAAKRVRRGAAFDKRVVGLLDAKDAAIDPSKPATLRLAGQRGAKKVDATQLAQLLSAGGRLVGELAGVKVTVANPKTGENVLLSADHIKNAQSVIATAREALLQTELSIKAKGLSLDAILSDPRVAARVIAKRGATSKSARAEALLQYRAAVETVRAFERAYSLRMHVPGVLEDRGLAKLGATSGADPKAVLAVAVRLRAPAEPVEITRALTQKAFGGITHLWLDPLMKGTLHASTLKARLKDKNGVVDAQAGKFIDRLMQFRDSDAVKVVAVGTDGKRLASVEQRGQKTLEPLGREVALRVLAAEYYCDASAGVRESFLKLVAAGAAMGFAMDWAAHASNNPSILQWKPTVAGGIDDAFGGALNAIEMYRNGKKGVVLDAVAATAFGVGTSVALGVGIPALGGSAISQMMMDPGTPLGARVAASAFYGVASSGATLAMSFLPARHYKKPLAELIKRGMVDMPPKLGDLPPTHPKVKRWIRKQSLKAHLNYTTQKGGLIGVGLSGVITGIFGLIPNWGGPAAANVLLGIGGAAETFTTGGYLYARETLDRRAIRNSSNKTLDRIGRGLKAK